MKLTSDFIYDAALDDGLFAELPSLIVKSLEARSCVLHWRDHDGTASVATHSGHFSDVQMLDYAMNYAEHDLWTDAGMRQGFVNRAWNTSDLVPLTEYERSIFYNEWIRGMGDDTFYCCGSVMETSEGKGIIGLHRGRTQADFSVETITELNSQIDHLRRMFTIRGRIAGLTRRTNLLDAIFESARHGAILVDRNGRILMANAPAEENLRRRRYLRSINGRLEPVIDRLRSAFQGALAEASGNHERRASTCLLRDESGGMIVASFVPILSRHHPATVLVTMEQERVQEGPDVVRRHLQEAFALSPAEAAIAASLANGDTIPEIAEKRQAATATVRTQVKLIFSKMHARRQGDIVRIVGRIAAGLPVAEMPDPTV